MAGPTTVAVWFAEAEPATARGRTGSGTSRGSIACRVGASKARPAPSTKTSARIKFAGEKSVIGADREHQRGQAFDELCQPHHAAAVVAVRHRACDQHQQKSRNELREPDQTQIERAAGHLIDLPADRHDLHLQCKARGDPRAPEQDEGTVMADRKVRIGHEYAVENAPDRPMPSVW